MRYLDDLVIGEQTQSRSMLVELAGMIEFARQYDPQYFHADPVAARSSVFGEVIASGIYTAALWRRLDHEISADIAWICGVAWTDTRWPHALRAGDHIQAQATVLSKRRSESNPSRGVVKTRYRLFNQRKQIVFECLSINLIETGPRDP